MPFPAPLNPGMCPRTGEPWAGHHQGAAELLSLPCLQPRQPRLPTPRRGLSSISPGRCSPPSPRKMFSSIPRGDSFLHLLGKMRSLMFLQWRCFPHLPQKCFSCTSNEDSSPHVPRRRFPPPSLSSSPLHEEPEGLRDIPGGAGGAEDSPGAALPPPGSRLRNSLKCWHLVAAWENSISAEARAAALRNP